MPGGEHFLGASSRATFSGVSPDAHKSLGRRYIDEAWHDGRPAAPFFAPHYRRHLSPGAAPLDGAGQQERITAFRAAFPDLRFTLEDLVVEGDRVVFRATVRGTHQGTFRGVPPTGREGAFTVLDVVRVEGGAFAEHWGGPDLHDLLQQLGAPAPAHAR